MDVVYDLGDVGTLSDDAGGLVHCGGLIIDYSAPSWFSVEVCGYDVFCDDGVVGRKEDGVVVGGDVGVVEVVEANGGFGEVFFGWLVLVAFGLYFGAVEVYPGGVCVFGSFHEV